LLFSTPTCRRTLILGLLIALPLGWLARRYRGLYPLLIVGTGLLYTIPSLALFIILPFLLGTQILDPLNVVIAMTLYTVALLVRTVADGLGSVPDAVNQSATAMGYRRGRRLISVELPLAVPVISAGLRVAAVSNVSIVSVAALIASSSWGRFSPTGSTGTSSSRSSWASLRASCWHSPSMARSWGSPGWRRLGSTQGSRRHDQPYPRLADRWRALAG